MRLAIGAIILLCAGALARAQSPDDERGREALEAIDQCVPRLDTTLDVGYERIAARCPTLAHRLERSGWAAWLPSGWKEARNDLSAGSLIELRTLVARELAASSGQGPQPSVAHLNEVLSELGSSTRRDDSLWSRFRAWLRTVVERNRQEDNSSWFDRMIQRSGRSQAMIELLTYTAMTLIVLLAGLIIANELKAAGLIRARARALAARAAAGGSTRGQLTWSDVESAPLGDKPRLLLELVIDHLTDTNRLPPAGALTVRELTRSVKLEDQADKDRLAELALAAERARYSAAALAPPAVDAVVKQGRELLARLAKPA